MQFTIEEIRKYLLSQDSMGDILYNLSEANIIKANEEEFLSDCCTAKIIHGDICSECLEHI